MPLSGWFLINSLRMICSTFIDWFAHSMRFLPRSASSNPLMSLLIDVVAMSLPDVRSEARGQICRGYFYPQSHSLLAVYFRLVRCCFLRFGFLTSDLISVLRLAPA